MLFCHYFNCKNSCLDQNLNLTSKSKRCCANYIVRDCKILCIGTWVDVLIQEGNIIIKIITEWGTQNGQQVIFSLWLQLSYFVDEIKEFRRDKNIIFVYIMHTRTLTVNISSDILIPKHLMDITFKLYVSSWLL